MSDCKRGDVCVIPKGYIGERDAILRERAAFEAGMRYAEPFTMSHADCKSCAEHVRERYPLPRVTRPRVVQTDDGWEFCFLNTRVDALLMGRRIGTMRWMNAGYPDLTLRCYKQLATLFENPTETVEDDA